MLDIINATIVSDEIVTRKVTIAVELKSSKADISYNDIANALSKKTTKDNVYQQNVKVYNGLLEFACDNRLTAIPFKDVIRNATSAADNKNISVIEYLAELGKDCIGNDEI